MVAVRKIDGECNREQVNNRSQTLLPLGFGGLLDETFAVYGRHIRQWLIIAAVIYLPVGLVSIGLGQLAGGPGVAVLTYVLEVAGAVLALSAVAYGVRQHYVTGVVGIRKCYARAWWMIRSLTLLSLAPVAALLAVALPSSYGGDVVGTVAAMLLGPIAIGAAVYWSMAVPAVVIEEQSALGALKRGFVLVQGSWWRAFGVALALMLVALGMAIVLTLPMGIAAALSGASLASRTTAVLIGMGGLVVMVVVPPVLMIAWTLLYNDLRVRKEKYDVAAMSRELGIDAT
jgi:hypothetical protein